LTVRSSPGFHNLFSPEWLENVNSLEKLDLAAEINLETLASVIQKFPKLKQARFNIPSITGPEQWTTFCELAKSLKQITLREFKGNEEDLAILLKHINAESLEIWRGNLVGRKFVAFEKTYNYSPK